MRAGLSDAQFPFLARLSRAARDELGALAITRARPRQRLLQRGVRANGAYLVSAGKLRVYYISEEGRDATLYNVEPGGTCVLALSASLSDEPYPAWVDAGATGCAFTRVPNALFQRFVEREPAFRQYVLSALSGRLLELMRTLEEAGSAQIEQRVARYLLRQASDNQVRVTQVGIASELGTAREVVFRSLRSLAEKKLIETGRGRIRILDANGLARRAR